MRDEMEKMKNRNLLKQQDSLTSRTTIEAEILFAVCLSKCGFWSESVKTPPKKSPCSKKIGAVLVQQADRRSFEASAVPILVYFYIIMINKYRQSAKRLLLNSPTDRTFENRWSRYKEPSKNKAEAYLVYVEHLFLRSDAGDARIFSKEKDVYGTDYGFGLDAPKETEQVNPQDLFAYRRNYTWNERNLLTNS